MPVACAGNFQASIPRSAQFSSNPPGISSPNQKVSVAQRIKPAHPMLADIIEIVSNAAIKTFISLGAAFIVNIAVIAFVAVPLGVPLTIGLFTNALLIAAIGLIPKMAWEMYHDREEKDNAVYKASRDIAGLSVANAIGLGGFNTFIHEMGHWITAKTLLKNSCASIKVRPYNGGVTTYYISKGLKPLGALLGKEVSLLCIAAAGITASVLFAMIEFGVAYGLKDKFPVISQWLNYHGVVQILNDVVYGLSTFSANQSDLSHDFVNLWTVGGIHPAIPIAIMIGLPLIQLGIFKLWELRKRSQKVSGVFSSVV